MIKWELILSYILAGISIGSLFFMVTWLLVLHPGEPTSDLPTNLPTETVGILEDRPISSDDDDEAVFVWIGSDEATGVQCQMGATVSSRWELVCTNADGEIIIDATGDSSYVMARNPGRKT